MKQLSINNLINSSTSILLTLLFLCLQLISCEKAPIRSDVEGFWKLERFTVLSTDETVECQNLYYSISVRAKWQQRIWVVYFTNRI